MDRELNSRSATCQCQNDIKSHNCVESTNEEIIEPRYEKTGFLHMRKTKTQISFAVSAFVFATQIVQSFYFLNPKFQASSYLLWLCRPVCVGPVRKIGDQFSRNEAQMINLYMETPLASLYKNFRRFE